MSNYEANPVGFLYERYQSSGVSPLYEVSVWNIANKVPCQYIILLKHGIESFSGCHVSRAGPRPYIHRQVDCAPGVFPRIVDSKIVVLVYHDPVYYAANGGLGVHIEAFH